MGRKPTLTEEAQALRDLIRQSHEVNQALREAIKEARQLAPDLVSQMQQVHHTEIKELSNYFNQESNLASAELNRQIEAAREMIVNTIMSGEAIFDRRTESVTIKFGAGHFDSDVPPPYPDHPVWKEP